MQSSLPTLSLQRFYLSRTLQTPRQALREQESTLPSRVWKLRQRQLHEGLPGARSHSPAGKASPESAGGFRLPADRMTRPRPAARTRPLAGGDHRAPTCRGLRAATPLAAGHARSRHAAPRREQLRWAPSSTRGPLPAWHRPDAAGTQGQGAVYTTQPEDAD